MTKMKRLIKKLNECRELADELGLLAGNGAELGSIIGTIADELEVQEQQSQQ